MVVENLEIRILLIIGNEMKKFNPLESLEARLVRERQPSSFSVGSGKKGESKRRKASMEVEHQQNSGLLLGKTMNVRVLSSLICLSVTDTLLTWNHCRLR